MLWNVRSRISYLVYRISFVIISALFLILSFPNYNLEFLAWVAFVPLFFALEGLNARQSFLLAYLWGVLFFLGTIYWLIHVTLPGMIGVVLYLAVYFGLYGLLINMSARGSGSGVRGLGLLFFAPAAWVTLEWLRGNLFTGFPWALLAYSQSFNLPVIQIADIFGAYGISFLVVMVNVALFLGMKNLIQKKSDAMPLVITLICFICALAYGYYRLNNLFTGEMVKVAVVQGNIPQDKKWDAHFRQEIMARYERLTIMAAEERPDIIIWPETSVPGFLTSERDLLERIGTLTQKVHIPLVVGAPHEDGKKKEVYYNSAFLISDDGQIQNRYDKMHLVPFGEYIPQKKIFSFVEKYAPLPIGDFSHGTEFTVFKLPIERRLRTDTQRWHLVKNVLFSSLICFEDIFPELSRNFVKNGATILVNITNDAWFKRSSAPYQHAQASVFRAVENRVNVIRAANTGFSCFIDQKGRVVKSLVGEGGSIFVEGVTSCDVTVARTRTFYGTFGDMFAYLCIGAVIVMTFVHNKNTTQG